MTHQSQLKRANRLASEFISGAFVIGAVSILGLFFFSTLTSCTSTYDLGFNLNQLQI